MIKKLKPARKIQSDLHVRFDNLLTIKSITKSIDTTGVSSGGGLGSLKMIQESPMTRLFKGQYDLVLPAA